MVARSSHSHVRTILFLVAVLLANVVVVVAQDDDVIRTDTDLVVLNVTVTDKAGKYVKGLKASDFKVYEDGVEVKTEHDRELFSSGITLCRGGVAG